MAHFDEEKRLVLADNVAQLLASAKLSAGLHSIRRCSHHNSQLARVQRMHDAFCTVPNKDRKPLLLELPLKCNGSIHSFVKSAGDANINIIAAEGRARVRDATHCSKEEEEQEQKESG